MTERFEKQIEFLVEIDKMKTIFRKTLLMDKSRTETDAEHSWHFAIMAMVLYEYADPEVDMLRVLKMALVHDLVEIYAGDTPAYDVEGNLTKAKREEEAADKIFGMLPKDQGEEYRALWEEFDAMETKDSLFAASVDRLQPFISNWKTDGHSWKFYNVKASQVYERVSKIKTGIPKLWNFVDGVIKDAVLKGHLLDE